jgi:PHD/YefM family antitoxin component YafN of YafNO toxin-antitoxin module
MQTITATELARNTRELLDSVASSGRAIAVERNRVRVAVLAPVERTMTAAQALQGLPQPQLTPAQAAEWLSDSKTGFDDAVHNPWA